MHLPLTCLALLAALAGGVATPTVTTPPAAGDEARTALTPAERSLRDRARAALVARFGEERAGRIRIRVEGTSLWLSGETADGYERDDAREAAHTVPGVTRVDIGGLATR